MSIASENESSSAKMQTYSEVAAMPVKQDDSRTEVAELCTPVVEQTSSSYSTEKMPKIYSEKQSARKCEIYLIFIRYLVISCRCHARDDNLKYTLSIPC